MAPIADRRPTEIMIQFRGVAIATPQLQNVLGRSGAGPERKPLRSSERTVDELWIEQFARLVDS